MPQDPKSQPNYETAEYREMTAAWTLVRDVSGGTAKMRAARENYLPREPGEFDPAYSRRLIRSVLFNAYKRTRGALVGLVCKRDPVVGPDVPPELKKHLENIDLAGTHLDVFTKELFEDAFEGHAFILVDMQKPLPEGSTKADEQAAGLRPYWNRYKADQAINWFTSRIDGEEHLEQITFRECSYERDGEYGEKDVTRYRVFRRLAGVVSWQLYRLEKKEGAEVSVTLEDAGITKLSRIPVAIVYGRRLGFMKSEPPLLDLAYLNVAHWQEYSDYRNALHIAQVPLLKRKGASAEQRQQEPAAGGFLDVPSDGDIAWIEGPANNLEASRSELVDLEQRMAMMGLSMLSQRADSNITATEKKIDQSERQSDLATMARSLKDCLELAVGLSAEYMGLDLNKDGSAGGSIELGVKDEELLRFDPAMIDAQAQKVDGLGLSKRQALIELGYTEEELTRILDEKKAETQAATFDASQSFNAGA